VTTSPPSPSKLLRAVSRAVFADNLADDLACSGDRRAERSRANPRLGDSGRNSRLSHRIRAPPSGTRPGAAPTTDQIASRRGRRDDAAPRALPVLVVVVVVFVFVAVVVVVVFVVVVVVVDETVLRMGSVLSCNTNTRRTTGYSRHVTSRASRASAGIVAILIEREREREREEGELVFPASRGARRGFASRP